MTLFRGGGSGVGWFTLRRWILGAGFSALDSALDSRRWNSRRRRRRSGGGVDHVATNEAGKHTGGSSVEEKVDAAAVTSFRPAEKPPLVKYRCLFRGVAKVVQLTRKGSTREPAAVEARCHYFRRGTTERGLPTQAQSLGLLRLSGVGNFQCRWDSQAAWLRPRTDGCTD